MLAEYAIIPDVFSASAYSTPEASKQFLSALKDGIRSRGLVRNLHSGDWLRFVEQNRARWDMTRIKELLKLIKRDRLCASPAFSERMPSTSVEWCQEALDSHEANPLQGIIANPLTAELHQGENLVEASTKLTECTWWLGGKNSIELNRTTEAYLQALRPTLRHSSSVMFIDPHLDPARVNYQDFVGLLRACGTRSLDHRIEIHRVCYTGSPKDRSFPTQSEWEEKFRSTLGQAMRELGLRVDVFLWDDFHDRYLISNLIGILIPNGFDTESKPSITRWARLDQEHRDSVQKEFEPAARMHSLRHRFRI